MPAKLSSRILSVALWLGPGVPVIFVIHAVAIFVLYAAHVSFVLLLFLSLTVAFGGYFYTVRASSVFRLGDGACGALAFWAFNTYGT